MHYKNGVIYYTNHELQQYKERLVNKCFAILGIYEDCESANNYNSYLTYLDRVKKEFVGFYNNTNDIQIISIVNILTGLSVLDDINHDNVKSLVFYMISCVHKVEV